MYDRLARLTERLSEDDNSLRYRALAIYATGVREFRKNRLEEAFASLIQSVQLQSDHASAWF